VAAATPEERLAELGLKVPAVAKPVAAYVPAVRSGSLVFTSGQLPMVDGALPRTGKVGAEVSAEEAKELAQRCALNALAAIKAEIGDLARVRQVVKLVGFVASAPDFTGQPGVINGASELLGQVFGEAGAHARSAVGVAVLPLDAPVEVELTVEIDAVEIDAVEIDTFEVDSAAGGVA
jgi:enamine deaminase RidA (YjgF/YER057c/UK114 family)